MVKIKENSKIVVQSIDTPVTLGLDEEIVQAECVGTTVMYEIAKKEMGQDEIKVLKDESYYNGFFDASKRVTQIIDICLEDPNRDLVYNRDVRDMLKTLSHEMDKYATEKGLTMDIWKQQ